MAELKKRIQFLWRMGISLFTRGSFVLLQSKSQTQAFAVKLRKTLQGKRGALLSDISQVGEPTYLEKSSAVFAFILNKVTLTKI